MQSLGISGKLEHPPSLQTIETHAELTAEGPVTLPSVDERLADLESRFEFFIEEQGLENKFRTELTEYVSDLRAEVKFTKTAKIIFGVISTVCGIGLLAASALLSYFDPEVFSSLTDYPKAALFIGMIAGGVTIILAITKSVFRSAHERQADEFIPPQIKLIHELTKGGN